MWLCMLHLPNLNRPVNQLLYDTLYLYMCIAYRRGADLQILIVILSHDARKNKYHNTIYIGTIV